MEEPLLTALVPVLQLLALGVLTVIVSRMTRISAIVGYLLLGVFLNATGLVAENEAVELLAELGVIFLLFDVGLHFSARHLRQHLPDVLGFGPLQMALCTLGLGFIGIAMGLPPATAIFIGGTLSLSSTAVVERLISERHQESCPVGLTATGILVSQDIAAIFLLIIATAVGSGGPLAPVLGLAFIKAVAAFAAAMLCARFLVRPIFDLIAYTRNEEVFTAMALLVALATGWVTGSLGLSMTLGAFLGGMMLAETPYRPVIQSEIKPFRGLLLGFFFISVGLSFEMDVLWEMWATIIAVGTVMILAKIVLNALSALVFRWSLPGSVQLGFLLSQGSEFALVIFALPPVRSLIGDRLADILIAAVVLSLGVTPHLADLGRWLAGCLRQHGKDQPRVELAPSELAGPVLIVGMGARGRTIADALTEFDIHYAAVEPDTQVLRQAIADGYKVVFGDVGDPRIWGPAALRDRKISVLTAPSFELSSNLTPVVRDYYPHLTRIALLDDPAEAAQFASIGLVPVIDCPEFPGLSGAAVVLTRLGASEDAVRSWEARRREARMLASSAGFAVV